MAGIGFELRKVAAKQGLTGLAGAAFGGSLIVAGPWLISILGIGIIQRFLTLLLPEGTSLFITVVVYSYSASLILGSGFHYIVTRITADYLYYKNKEAAFFFLLSLFPWVIAISGLLSSLGFLFLFPTLPKYSLFQLGGTLLFISINLLWFLMLFISVLTWYGKIILAFILGFLTGTVSVIHLAERFGTPGALLGFALGHFVILLLLLLLCFASIKPKKDKPSAGLLTSYFQKYKSLFVTGFVYSLAIWIDKIVYWFIQGSPVPGTLLPVYEPYDFIVYLANLIIIPGLVFFIIVAETNFYIHLKRFLLLLNTGRYSQISKIKYKLYKKTGLDLISLALFQGLICLGLILATPGINRLVFQHFLNETSLQLYLGGVFFHILLITLLNFLFYTERFKRALTTSWVFLGMNLLISLLTALEILPLPAGTGYLLAAFTAAVTGFFQYSYSMKRLERFIYSGP